MSLFNAMSVPHEGGSISNDVSEDLAMYFFLNPEEQGFSKREEGG